MSTPITNQDQNEEGKPPIFKTWNQLYIFVLIFHAFIITLFYIITKTYS